MAEEKPNDEELADQVRLPINLTKNVVRHYIQSPKRLMAKRANSSSNLSNSNPQRKGMQCSYIAYLIVMQRNTIGRKVRGGWREM